MKNSNYSRLVSIFITLLTLVTSCSSDDDNTSNDPNNSSTFLDKWWYDSDDFAADIYFHSNGEYEQKKVVQGTSYIANGDWVYENESSGIIRIDNLVGNGQTQSTIWLKVSNIQVNTITIQQSSDGTDYSEAMDYQDTDN